MKAFKKNIEKNQLDEPITSYGFVHKSEDEKLLEDVFKSDLEKLRLFTRMLYRNSSLRKVKILRKNN